MTPSTPRLRLPGIVLAVAVAAGLAACSSSGLPPAATVGDQTISQAQVKANVPLFTFLASLSQAPCGQAAQGETPAAACSRFTLGNLIQEDIVKAYAQDHHVTVPSGDVSKLVDQLTTQLGGQSALNQTLSGQGMTPSDLRTLTGRLLLFRDVRTDISNGQITDAQVKQSYDQQRDQFTQIHAAHILVKTKKEADKIYAQATPKNFADLAKKYSLDTQSAQNGGDIGTQPAGQLDPAFASAALHIKPGEIGKPVQSQFGWHVIMTIDPPQITPFAQASTQVRDQMSSSIFQKWMTGQLEHTPITVNPGYGKLDKTTGQVDAINSTATGSPTPPGASAGAPPAGSSPSP